MTTQIALLRAINVGGRNRLPMVQLRAICATLGWTDVRTYIQSGNVVFTPPTGADRCALSTSLEQAILAQVGLTVPVLIRSRANIAQAVKDNPFSDAEPKFWSAVFLSEVPADPNKLNLDRSPPDRLHLAGDILYWHAPNGVGRSKITTAYLDRVLGVTTTARNGNTVNKLLALSE